MVGSKQFRCATEVENRGMGGGVEGIYMMGD